MSTRVLSLNEIDNRCLSLVNSTLPYYPELAEAFKVLYLSGCRISEIFEIERWEFLYDYTLSLLPQKGNNLRYVALDATCSNFIAAVVGQYKPFLGRTPGQLDNLLNKLKTWDNFEVGSKKRASYIFRYNFVKQLDNSGFTLAEIASIMGYTSTDTPNAYLQAEVVENFTPPPIDTITIGGQVWMAKNLDIDDGGSGIYYPNGDVNNVADFGLLYTYDAAVRVAASLSPSFALPNNGNFNTLLNFLGGFRYSSHALRCTGTAYWKPPNSTATNSSGFCGRGAGGRSAAGVFNNFLAVCFLWSITSIGSQFYRFYFNTNSNKVTDSYDFRTAAYSVRLIRD